MRCQLQTNESVNWFEIPEGVVSNLRVVLQSSLVVEVISSPLISERTKLPGECSAVEMTVTAYHLKVM